MQRRKFVIGAGALATGSAAAFGTGAFDSVEAEREVDVNIEGDAAAYLGITGDDVFVGDDSDDSELTIDLGGPDTGNGGEGFNANAITEVSDVITLTNQSSDGNNIEITELDQPDDAIEFELSDDITLTPGDSVGVDVTVDDLDQEVPDEPGDLSIEAESV